MNNIFSCKVVLLCKKNHNFAMKELFLRMRL